MDILRLPGNGEWTDTGLDPVTRRIVTEVDLVVAIVEIELARGDLVE